MDRTPRCKTRPLFLAILATSYLLTQAGCAGLLANLLYNGHMVPAKYTGLRDQKVAVVCVSNDSIYNPHSTSAKLARRVEQLLQAKVRQIQIIDQDQVADWIDNNEWDQVDYDYRKIGRGLEADKVVVVELTSYRLHEGGTMYKGRCELNAFVYDITGAGEKTLILDGMPVVYPANGGQSTATRSEGQFENDFLNVVAHDVAKNFYRYDLTEDMALDATFIGS
jgi:hypothetical protein